MTRSFKGARADAFIARLRNVMGEGRWSAKELAAAMHCEVSGIHQYLRHLMDAKPRQVYISGWRRNDAGRRAPLYKLGSRSDAKCPPGVPNKDRLRIRRETMPEIVNANQRHAYMLRKVRKNGPSIFAALGL